jgi:hypothetical protein
VIILIINDIITGYFTRSIHQGINKTQLLKLINHLPNDGLFIPHSVRNDSNDEKQIFGFLNVNNELRPIDDTEIESINLDLITLYRGKSAVNPTIYKSHKNRKYFLKTEKISIRDIVLKNEFEGENVND